MVIEIVNNYRNLLRNIGNLIDVSGYRNEHVARKMGLSKANFSAKKIKGSFSIDEIEKLIKIIENEDVEDYLMLQLMRERKNDESVSYEDAKKLLQWK